MNPIKDALNRFGSIVAVCGGTILLCLGQTATADELQDANKLFKQGQHEQALAQVNAYLNNKPKDAQARFLKGLILTDEDKTNDAIRVFSELTEDYPELPEPYNNLAVLYASQGQYDKARISLEMAIRTHPSYATAHENLGDIYAKMASQAYDRALQLDRGNTSTQTKLELIKELFTKEMTSGSKVIKPVVVASNTTAPMQSGDAKNAESSPRPAQSAPPARQATPDTSVKQPVTGNSGSKPAMEKPAAQDDRSEVLKAVRAWAAAWSSKDVAKYLSYYASDFAVPDGQSRSAWEAVRTDRINKPKFIHVGIDGAAVKLEGDSHASVTFSQSYSASHYKVHGKKTLKMVKAGGQWLIQEEQAGK